MFIEDADGHVEEVHPGGWIHAYECCKIVVWSEKVTVDCPECGGSCSGYWLGKPALCSRVDPDEAITIDDLPLPDEGWRTVVL